MAELRVPDEFATIQAAVDAANPGDTILVAPGNYPESVTLPPEKERLWIEGAGADRTIIDGRQRLSVGLVVEGAQSTILNIAVRRFRSNGVEVSSPQNQFASLIIEQNGRHGIELAPSARENLLEELIVRQNGVDGIYVVAGTRLLRNQVSDNGATGIVANGPDNLLEGNRSVQNGAQGIAVAGRRNRLLRNTAEGNRSAVLGSGILVTGEEHELALNSAIENGKYGLELIGTHRSTVTENLVTKNGLGGICLRGGTANRLIGNEVRSNGYAGIGLEGPASRNLVDDNQVVGNRGAGIALTTGARENAIRFNRAVQNNPDLVATSPDNLFARNEAQRTAPQGLGTSTVQILLVPERFPTIQEAVDAARPGQVILVGANHPWEPVTIPTGKDRLLIQGGGPEPSESGFHVEAELVTIRGIAPPAEVNAPLQGVGTDLLDR